jgi:hypothetical protein
MSRGGLNGRDFLFYTDKCAVFHFLLFEPLGVS